VDRIVRVGRLWRGHRRWPFYHDILQATHPLPGLVTRIHVFVWVCAVVEDVG